MSRFLAVLLFLLNLLMAVAFARYFVLSVKEDDRPFAIAAAVAFVVMCGVATAVFFGWV